MPASRGTRFIVYQLPLLLYMGLIFQSSSGPITNQTIQSIPDYLLHCAAYTVLYVLAFRAMHEGWRPKPGRGSYWVPALITIGYGIADEFHQSFVPMRDASLHDVLADAAGAALGAAIMYFLFQWHTGSPKNGREPSP